MSKGERRWTITELSREFAVTSRALRFYEDKGLLRPERVGLSRHYSARDRARLQLILRGKRLGFPLAEIRSFLDLYDLKDGRRAQMEEALAKFRDRIAALESQRVDLDAVLGELQDNVRKLEGWLAAAESPGAPTFDKA